MAGSSENSFAIFGMAIDSVTRSIRLMTTSTNTMPKIRQRTVLAAPAARPSVPTLVCT